MDSGSLKSVATVRTAKILLFGVCASVVLVMAIFFGYPAILRTIELSPPTLKTPRITGFVGINMSQANVDKDIYKKIPSLTEAEARKIIGRIEEGASKPKPKVVFGEGDVVRVVDGPFANFQGVVDEVFPDKGRVRVMVSIFGRSTPVELEYIQVSKN